MAVTTIRRALAAAALCATLTIGPMALVSTAQQPSDPGGCTESCTGGGGNPDDVQVLGETIIREPGQSSGSHGSLAKTGADIALLVLAGAGAAAGGLSLRKIARRS